MPPKGKAAAKSKSPKGKDGEKKDVEDVVDKLFAISDINKNGVIEFGEFLAHHRSIMSSTDIGAAELDDKQLEQKFRKHDTDRNHKLDRQEFMAYMEGVFTVLGRRRFLDVCNGLVEETLDRLEELRTSFNPPCSERLLEKARAANYFVPTLQQAAVHLLEQKADPNFIDPTGSHALLYAVDKADDTFIARLLKARANPALHNKDMESAAFKAARARNVDVLSLLLRIPGAGEKAKEKEKEAKEREDGGGDRSEKAKASEDLVRKMAELTAADVTALLKKGADMNHRDDNGWTPLTAAVFWGKEDCLQTLLRTQTTHATVKLKLELANGRGRSALHIAARKGRTELIVPIVRARGDVDVQDMDGWTALHHAAFNSNSDCIVALVENNANLQIQTKTGLTPYQLTKIASCSGRLNDKAKKVLEPGEHVSFSKLVVPVLKDETLSMFDKLEKLLSAPGVCQVPTNLRLYEQFFDSRTGPNKIRLQKMWEGLARPIITRQMTGDTDLDPPTDNMAAEDKADRLAVIAARRKDQKAFLRQWFIDTRGPRPCSEWRFDNREGYGEELREVVAQELGKFRTALEEMYVKLKEKPEGAELASRPSSKSFGCGCTSQLQVHPIPGWLQSLDPACAYDAFRLVGALGQAKEDDEAMLTFVDLLANHSDFDTGKAFWTNAYRWWLCAYAKLADADFQRRIAALVNKFSEAHAGDPEMEVSILSVPPKSYERVKEKEAKFGQASYETYEGRTIAANVLDIIRCSLTVNSPKAILALIDEVFMPLTVKKNSIELIRVENRFSADADTERLMGYRDVELSLLFDAGPKTPTWAMAHSGASVDVAVIGEVQIVLEDFLAVKKQRHLLFQCSQGDFDWSNTDHLDDDPGAQQEEEFS